MYGKVVGVLETDLDILWAFELPLSYTTNGPFHYADVIAKLKREEWKVVHAVGVPTHAMKHLNPKKPSEE